MRTTIVLLISALASLAAAGCAEEPADDGDRDGDDQGLSEPLQESDGAATASAQPGYCTSVADWDDESIAFETQVIALVNKRRAAGATCGGVKYGAAPPLKLNTYLRCAARNHSRSMAVGNYTAHTDPNGTTAAQRIAKAGYAAASWGENIAWGWSTPEIVVNAWMKSEGHCKNIMNKSFTQLGVGHFYEENDKFRHYWTQDFGRPK